MLVSHFKIALANLLNHKLYSSINVLGLAAGLAACLLISLFVRYELTYDSFFPNSERIYRLSAHFAATGGRPEFHVATNVGPLTPLIETSAVDGIQEVGRMSPLGGTGLLVARDDVSSYDEKVQFADDAIFRIFQFDWLRGDAKTAFDAPDSAVISQGIARKYFGEVDPLGRSLMIGNNWSVTVRGVIADIPRNSHLAVDIFLPIALQKSVVKIPLIDAWTGAGYHTYVLLRPGFAIDKVNNDIQTLVDSTLAAAANEGPALGITPYALTDIHLHPAPSAEMKESGDLAFVFMFSAVAALLLGIACINFMNLSTARAATRAKEVGMRKAVGATRGQLMAQFLGESFLVAGLALMLALVLVELLLPAFSGVVGRPLDSGVLATRAFVIFIAGITVLTALVAGSYPALHLSVFRPVDVLRMRDTSGRGSFTLRNTLVIFQFTLAIALIIVTVVVQLQMRFTHAYDLGYITDQMLVLRGTRQDGLGKQWPVLKQELLRHPQISHIAEGVMQPGSIGAAVFKFAGGPPQGQSMSSKQVGFGFFEAYDIALKAGRYFDESRRTDGFVLPVDATEARPAGGSFILNETAVRAIGLEPEQAIGLELEVTGTKGPVVGVVEDVNAESLHLAIRPLVYLVPAPVGVSTAGFNTASVRIIGDQPEAVVEFIRARWKTFVPELPLNYHFLDVEFGALYQSEEQQGKLFTFFSLLTIVIACLGLFGLASFTVERRVKEIGMRKIMGGSVISIVMLLTNGFSKLVLLSNLVAWPLAYFAINRWLQNFAYHVDLTPVVFIGSGLIALCIAWATVGGTAAKAASTKPVLALRYE